MHSATPASRCGRSLCGSLKAACQIATHWRTITLTFVRMETVQMKRYPDAPEFTGLNAPLGEEYEVADLAIGMMLASARKLLP